MFPKEMIRFKQFRIGSKFYDHYENYKIKKITLDSPEHLTLLLHNTKKKIGVWGSKNKKDKPNFVPVPLIYGINLKYCSLNF